MPNEDAPYDPFTGLEAWEWTGAGKLYVALYTGKYGDIRYEAVHGGRVFHLTPAERRLNSQKSASVAVDPFMNGGCVMVALTDETPAHERAAIESNPQSMNDDQIAALFKPARGVSKAALAEALETKLGLITNATTLARIFDAAKAADVSLSMVSMIQVRIAEVTGITEGGRVMIPVFNELDSPEIYGQDVQAGSRGIAEVTVGAR